MSEALVSSLDALLTRASATARTRAARDRLDQARSRLLGPLRVAVAGKVKAGKSTLLNAIVGQELAPTDAGECTKVVTWYEWGDSPGVWVHPSGRSPVQRPWTRDEGALDVDLGALSAAELDRIQVKWPISRLHELTIIDTPGIASISAEVSQRTIRALAADDGKEPIADAVLYLMRHTHASDIGFLEAFHDDDLGQGTPVNSVGVLSRADEIGSCRLDAMEVATRIATRYERDPRIRRLCPVVVPVDGLLAHASATLREAEFAILALIARASDAEVEELLLTADRFLQRATSLPLSRADRARLLDRLGLFGVRISVDLIRYGAVGTAAALAVELSACSGLDALHSVLLQQFDQRSRVLKARSALAVLNDVLRSDGCAGGTSLLASFEELSSSTHEFEEIRMLRRLRSGDLDMKSDRLADLDRLLGGHGHGASSRLGLSSDADAGDIRAAALDALTAWRRTAEHPLSSVPVQTAAQVATRTLEGLVAGVGNRTH